MKTRIILYIFALSMLLNTGCKLDYDPLGDAYGQQVWSTAKGCEQMLSGAYSRLRKVLIMDNPMYLYGDLPASTLLMNNNYVKKQVVEGNYVGSYIASYNWLDWTSYFQVINTTNTLLRHLNDVPLSDFDSSEDEAIKKRDRIRGEAYFLYAYTYFHMVRIYGDLPLVQESFESVEQGLDDGNTIPRIQSSEKEVLQFILKPIDASISLLTYDKKGDDKWAVQADRAAALTLKAHTLLWLARDLNNSTEDFTKYVSEAEKCLDIVMNQSNRTLVNYDNPDNVENMFDGQSSEGIFELHISVADNESYRINGTSKDPIHTVTWTDASKETLNSIDDYITLDPAKALMLYPSADKRRNLFFQNFGNQTDDTYAPPFMLKYAAHVQEDPSDSKYYFANSNVLIFRLSDCILLRAEALTKLGRHGQAKDLLNLIRERAGIGKYIGSNSNLIKEIFEERARELVGEGHSAYDRIRNDYWDGNDFMSEERKAKKGYYWPVDIQRLQSANTSLYQVPYWVGKL